VRQYDPYRSSWGSTSGIATRLPQVQVNAPETTNVVGTTLYEERSHVRVRVLRVV